MFHMCHFVSLSLCFFRDLPMFGAFGLELHPFRQRWRPGIHRQGMTRYESIRPSPFQHAAAAALKKDN